MTQMKFPSRLGFMQGRLSPLVNGKIQAFPEEHWREEFHDGVDIGLQTMEWTLDQARLYDNPLMNEDGQNEIDELSASTGLNVVSVTGDCFMQFPFWKVAQPDERNKLIDDFVNIVEACGVLHIDRLVVPIVDNGALQDANQEKRLVDVMTDLADMLRHNGVSVAFECDHAPDDAARFIDQMPEDVFGINYDIGNSAALGFDCVQEIASYGSRIINVHVKDRVRGGTTVPLGSGDANIPLVISLLSKMKYEGRYILQTARATDDDHKGVLLRYASYVNSLLMKDDSNGLGLSQ